MYRRRTTAAGNWTWEELRGLQGGRQVYYRATFPIGDTTARTGLMAVDANRKPTRGGYRWVQW